MSSVLVWPFLAHLLAETSAIITFAPFKPHGLWDDIPIIDIPTTEEGNFERRVLGMPKGDDTKEVNRWWNKVEPEYIKFVTEQIRKEEEEKKRRTTGTTLCSEELLAKFGPWQHYYDYGTKELERFEKKLPPEPGRMSFVEQHKRLKKLIQERQRVAEESYVDVLDSNLRAENEELRRWIEVEEKAGRLKCECKNNTVTYYKERYTVPEDGYYHPGMWSKE